MIRIIPYHIKKINGTKIRITVRANSHTQRTITGQSYFQLIEVLINSLMLITSVAQRKREKLQIIIEYRT